MTPSDAERMLHDYEFEGSERQTVVEGRQELNVVMMNELQQLFTNLEMPHQLADEGRSLTLTLRGEDLVLYWTASDTRLRLGPSGGRPTDGVYLDVRFTPQRTRPAIAAKYVSLPMEELGAAPDTADRCYQGLDAVVSAMLGAHRKLVRSRASGAG